MNGPRKVALGILGALFVALWGFAPLPIAMAFTLVPAVWAVLFIATHALITGEWPWE